MIRLGVLSDSHQAQFWTERFLDVANRARYDAVCFLGDGESEARWLKRRLEMPLYCVAGNCDVFSKEPREQVLELGGHRVLITHGHLLEVKWSLERLSYRAEEQGADIALYGHTHIPRAEYVGPVLTVNPGALMNGRYAELTLDGDKVIPYLKDFKEQ